jgi:hypothetical protein
MGKSGKKKSNAGSAPPSAAKSPRKAPDDDPWLADEDGAAAGASAMDLLRKISTEMGEIKLRVSQLETKHSRASATPPMSETSETDDEDPDEEEDQDEDEELTSDKLSTLSSGAAKTARMISRGVRLSKISRKPVADRPTVKVAAQYEQMVARLTPKLERYEGTDGMKMMRWLAQAENVFRASGLPKKYWHSLAATYLGSQTAQWAAQANNWKQLKTILRARFCPDAIILNEAHSLVDSKKQPLDLINGFDEIENMFRLCEVDAVLPDVWRIVLLFRSMPLRVQDLLKPHMTLHMSAVEFEELAVRLSTGTASSATSAPPPVPPSIPHAQSLNAIALDQSAGARHTTSHDVDLSGKTAFQVQDYEAFQKIINAATDAMVLNHISTMDRPTVPLDAVELNYISKKGLSGPLADKVVALVSKMPKNVRTQLMREGKCFICKQRGHVAVVCPMLPED